jgi:hypothetical protein
MLRKSCNYLDTMKFGHEMFFSDTTFPMSHTASSSQKEMTHGYWENHLCPAYGLFTGLRISQMRSTLQWPLQSQTLFLLEPISLYGLCSTHLSGKPPRHRGLSPFSSTKTLSYGFSQQRLPQHSGSCQSDQGLANLCRFCPDPHRPSASHLRQRFLWCRIRSNGLRLGLHDHRSVSLPLSLGQIPSPQSCCETAHPPGPPGKYSLSHYYHSWQSPRRQYPRSVDLRTRCLLYYRPWVSRFRPPLCDPSSISFLCHPDQKQLQVQTSLFSACRQIHRSAVRPNCYLGRLLFQESLSRQTPAYSVFRQRPKRTVRLFNQQSCSIRIDHRSAVSVSLADRNIFQMDQTAPSHQSVLWDHRECCQNSDLDRHYRYVLVAIIKKQLKIDLSLYTILQILSVTLFEKTPILEALSVIQHQESKGVLCNQLTLFD